MYNDDNFIKKISFFSLLAILALYFMKIIIESFLTDLYSKYFKQLIDNNIQLITILTIFLILSFLGYVSIKLYREYKKIKLENQNYKKYMEYGVSLVGLKDQIEQILNNSLQEGEDVSLYILNKNEIYNFITLPNDTTGIHHYNKIFSKDRKSIIGTSFIEKKMSVVKLDESMNKSEELKKSVLAYKLDINSFLITIPYLDRRNEVTFAIQILRKNKFSEIEISHLKSFLLPNLNDLLEKIYRIPEWESLIPQLKNRNLELYGCCIFFDLSNSSDLLNLLPLEKAQKEINNFISIMCDVALDRGAKIDKYTGDGAFITFNLVNKINNYNEQAIESAIFMVKEMDKLRNIWLNNYYLSSEIVNKFKIRIGVSCGKVRAFTIGHQDYKYDTFIGKPIHTAYHLCEGHDSPLRDRILIDGKLKNYINSNTIQIKEYHKEENFSKSVQFSPLIYEIIV